MLNTEMTDEELQRDLEYQVALNDELQAARAVIEAVNNLDYAAAKRVCDFALARKRTSFAHAFTNAIKNPWLSAGAGTDLPV